MARIHYWQYLADNTGTPISGVDIRFYLQGTTTEANIYANPTVGHTTTTSALDIQSNVDGYFEFWIGDEWELNGGYESTQRFQITWQKAGITNGEINNLDIYPPLYPIDETASGTTTENSKKNKLISNSLAKDWTDHVEEILPTDDPHNLQPVVICSSSNAYNKVVSDKLMSDIYTTAASASSVTMDTSAADGYESTPTAFTANVAENFNHALDNSYPIVQVADTTDDIVIIPDKIESIDADNVEVTLAESITAVVTIIG